MPHHEGLSISGLGDRDTHQVPEKRREQNTGATGFGSGPAGKDHLRFTATGPDSLPSRNYLAVGDQKFQDKKNAGSDAEGAGTLWYNPRAKIAQNYEILSFHSSNNGLHTIPCPEHPKSPRAEDPGIGQVGQHFRDRPPSDIQQRLILDIPRDHKDEVYRGIDTIAANERANWTYEGTKILLNEKIKSVEAAIYAINYTNTNLKSDTLKKLAERVIRDIVKELYSKTIP